MKLPEPGVKTSSFIYAFIVLWLFKGVSS